MNVNKGVTKEPLTNRISQASQDDREDSDSEPQIVIIEEENSEGYVRLQKLRKPGFNPNNPNDYFRKSTAIRIVLQDTPNKIDLEKEVLKILRQNQETKLTRYIC